MNRTTIRRLNCESLEKRELMAGISFQNGIVTVEGSDSRDICSIGISGTQMQVHLSGPTNQIRQIPMSQVSQIIFNAHGGNDEFYNRTNVSSIAYGGNGNDYLVGGGGKDQLFGGNGNDELIGLGGNDNLFGGSGNDSLKGGVGDDYLSGGHGDDFMDGLTGNDQLYGDDGKDQMFGGDGDDRLFGGFGNDSLFGGRGTDRLIGNEGDDYLDGGSIGASIDGAVDHLEGNSGADFFAIETYRSNGKKLRRDRVMDLNAADRFSEKT